MEEEEEEEGKEEEGGGSKRRSRGAHGRQGIANVSLKDAVTVLFSDSCRFRLPDDHSLQAAKAAAAAIPTGHEDATPKRVNGMQRSLILSLKRFVFKVSDFFLLLSAL